MGLMWTQIENGQLISNQLRHTCEQNEGMDGYGWEFYDPRLGGLETIHDTENHVDISISFLKDQSDGSGQSWVARIKGSPRADAPSDLETALIFYLGSESEGSSIQCEKVNVMHSRRAVECQGDQPGIGDWKLDATKRTSDWARADELSRTTLRSVSVSSDDIWKAKSIYLDQAIREEKDDSNLHFIRQDRRGAFEFDVFFSSASGDAPLPGKDVSTEVETVNASFSAMFEDVYAPSPPFDNAACKMLSRSLLSNLMGGIGYFYGDSRVDVSPVTHHDENDLNFWNQRAAGTASRLTQKTELLSMVPSRPFFPRGFLWDEGFHLLVVLDWDLDLTMEIVKSWLALMDDDGWIAREQILGPEARSKVPEEFQVQYPHHANPPTLFLVISAFIDMVEGRKLYHGHASQYLGNTDEATRLLKELYPLLVRHYNWFRKTQSGDLMTFSRPGHSAGEAYRWRGRTDKLHTLTSGLDDYPRAQPPHPGELHLDALCWVGTMATVLEKMAMRVGTGNDQKLFSRHRRANTRNIETLHWSDKDQAYCDATIENGRHTLVCHKGYISLFPFLLGLLDTSNKHISAVLDLVKDDNELWSPHGIRSLSLKDKYYGKDENYWRGPIWININYLILERLLALAQLDSPHKAKARSMYNTLRRNLVTTVYNSWRDTGFAWEQYNPDTGAGQRTQHFTGWTALVVKIAAMPELPEVGGEADSRPSQRLWLQSPSTLIFLVVIAVFLLMFRRRIGVATRGLLRRMVDFER